MNTKHRKQEQTNWTKGQRFLQNSEKPKITAVDDISDDYVKDNILEDISDDDLGNMAEYYERDVDEDLFHNV